MAKNGKLYESDFEEALVGLFEKVGWEYSHGDNIYRKFTDPLIESDLRDYLNGRYGIKQLSKNDFDGIVENLRLVSEQNEYYSLQKAFYLYRDGYNFTPEEGETFKLEYIDFENPERNIFRCVNQFVMEQGSENRRPDVLLFVNGIPVCIIELKNPTNVKATVLDAHTQICTRYMRDIPNLMKFCPLAVISDAAKTELGTPFTPFEYFYEWKKVENEDKAGKGLDTLSTLVQGALAPERILEILRDYVYFPDPSDSQDTTEIVCRYPQFFATRKLRNHVLNHLRSVGGDGKGGTYFGATGCGKTYTMLFLARQLALRCKSQLGSPTIVLIVDREDLETQAGTLFCASKKYLGDDSVEIFDSRQDLADELSLRKTGGFFITTIQKFAETTGLLSDRANIVCMSDEAHRSQNNLGSKLVISEGDDNKKTMKAGETKGGAKITYGFATYLRKALPNATFVGFTGTPIDETVHVFGEIVDQYTMKESEEDGITVPIKYNPRLARVFLNKQQAEEVEKYYKECADEGAKPEDIAKSKKAMASMMAILDNEDRIKRVAKDIVEDYKKRLETTSQLQKAMVTCADRKIAYKLYKAMREIEPTWFEKKKALDEDALTAEQKDKLKEVAYVNIVCTRADNDDKELYKALGDKAHRKFLDAEFKSEQSNFHIAIVVDMWITGFDVPSLTMLYNDKPLSKHTLIQTISRVNRKYKDKEFGIVIDYLGIREEMKKAMKRYGGDVAPKEDLEVAHEIFANELQILKEMLTKLDFSIFFGDDHWKRLQFLQDAAEYILANTVEKKGEVSFMKKYQGHIKRLRSAYNILNPAGELNEKESAWAQCFMGISAYVSKMTTGVHHTEEMNKHVEKMVQEAIFSSGVETLFDDKGEEENIFSDAFIEELDDVKMPYTKFQLLVKLIKKAIQAYRKTNRLQAEKFETMLQKVIDEYNTRDNLTFTNDVASDTIDAVAGIVDDKIKDLTEKLVELFKDLKADSQKFKELGITFEEKAFYDVLVNVRDTHGFEYSDDRCIALAKKVKLLVDDMTVYADFINNNNLKSRLADELMNLIYKEGYPPEWSEDVFQKVLKQVDNYKNRQ